MTTPIPPDRVEREPDQEDILATALYLSQSNPQLFGMSAEAWVKDAIWMRKRIKLIADVFYDDDPTEAPL